MSLEYIIAKSYCRLRDNEISEWFGDCHKESLNFGQSFLYERFKATQFFPHSIPTDFYSNSISFFIFSGVPSQYYHRSAYNGLWCNALDNDQNVFKVDKSFTEMGQHSTILQITSNLSIFCSVTRSNIWLSINIDT